jgi:2-oxoglutarate ferredoxin oxidoreductase subunit beta
MTETVAMRSAHKPTWCPGCGNFGVLQAVATTLERRGVAPQSCALVSGIGCAGRFPFFTNAYGFHVAHGRALPVATGVHAANPALTVLAVGGDGDGLGIGMGHFLHAVRRNARIVYLMLDNSLYGLTKGQASPTSAQGTVTKSTPLGNPDLPVNPVALAIASGATFVARGFAGDVAGLGQMLDAALDHRGFSFLHVLTVCVTFGKAENGWEALRGRVHPAPVEEGGAGDAWCRAMDDPYGLGIWMRREAPSWEDRVGALRSGAADGR